MSQATLMIMAGGTGGHIMPGLAVAHALKEQGWRIVWLGDPERMEGRLVPGHGFELVSMKFAGVRGKGLFTLLKLPFTLARACWRARKLLRQYQPDVVLGMGGYVSVPGGLMARVAGIPLVIHEQNARAGTANKLLARVANNVLTGFPGALPNAVMVGNPVRAELLGLPRPELRYQQRQGNLNLLVLGGSLGAAPLNRVVPAALALMPAQQRPNVRHQAGEQHQQSVRELYREAQVDARVSAFIDDMAEALQWADLLICRAGAMTVAEVAAVGVAALFVPLPHAIDDHQSANASFLSGCKGAWLIPQSELSAENLHAWLGQRKRAELAKVAGHAYQHASPGATAAIAQACASWFKGQA